MRRYTRLSNGFSRKIENHMAAVAINYFAYNFTKIYRTLRVTPRWRPASRPAYSTCRILVNTLIESESKKPRKVVRFGRTRLFFMLLLCSCRKRGRR